VSYRIRSYGAGDRERVAVLLSRLWASDPALNERLLCWRYERNPYPGSCLVVCEQDGEIVAVRGAHGMLWRVGGSPVPMPCLGDTVVDKRHEGRGLVQCMTRWLMASLSGQGVEWVVNQSPGPLVEKISLRTGWRKVGEWTVAHAVRDPRDSAQGFERFDAAAAGPVERDGFRIRSGSARPEELAALVASVRPGHIAHIRDCAYFAWRFDNPFAEYRWLCAYSEDGLAGYLVLGRGRQRAWRIRVLDLQGAGGPVQSLLLDQALRWGEFREVRIWWNRFPRQVSHVLTGHGFTAASTGGGRRSTHLIAATRKGVERFEINGVDTLRLANWDPRMIHSDAT
jgi:hypothetical protein